MANFEDLEIFFNPEEFGIDAVIGNNKVPGIFSHTFILVNDVEARKPVFTCAKKAVEGLAHGELIKLEQQSYQVMGIKSEGLGLITFILEQACNED
jgi:hypothetical protein